ncbi:uncharacterized protein LOC112558387 [Pomacea canaliculata]|uniref:uncharacterized protein LOC112558387 n=1 Tax=Pomacea canaliculata TaxID=400727 RepID=UPI000D738D7B|nr:uncharacterized protein LOC112558387 [Pomacea canaliculata]
MLLQVLVLGVSLGLLDLQTEAATSTEILTLTKAIEDIKVEIENVKRNCNKTEQGGYFLEDGYVLAYKVYSGGEGYPVEAFYNTYGVATYRNDDDPFLRALMKCSCYTNGKCNRHYRSGLFKYWVQLGVTQVKLSVYKDGEEKQYAVFDGRDSSYLSWFNEQKLLESSWTDLKTAKKDYFSWDLKTLSDPRGNRRMFISNNSSDCATATGWLMLKESYDKCDWGNPRDNKFPFIIFSPTSTMVQFKSAEQADAVGVWIQYPGVENLSATCIQ